MGDMGDILDFYKDAFDEDEGGHIFWGVLAIPVLLLIFKKSVRGFLFLLAGLFKSYFFTTNSAYWLFCGFLFLLGLLFFFFFRDVSRYVLIGILGVVILAILIIGRCNTTKKHFFTGVYRNESSRYVLLMRDVECSDGRILPENTELLASFSKTKEYVTEYTLLVLENDGSISIEHITLEKNAKPFGTIENPSQLRHLFNEPIRQEYERQKQLFFEELDAKGIQLHQGNKNDSFLLQKIADKQYVDVTSLAFFDDDDNENVLWYVERKDYGKYKQLYKKHKRAVCKFSFKYSMEMTDGQYVLYY